MIAHLVTAPEGMRGFDCNVPLSTSTATAFVAAGYRFAVRYIPRVTLAPGDLTQAEVATIIDAGLGLMLVQHVESDASWTPNAAKAALYGTTAGVQLTSLHLPPGTMCWLDLEGIAPGTDAQAVIDYCNVWHSEVAGAGFLPGLYVGWHSRLTPQQLYQDLRFTHYWAAYNLNLDEYPAVRGVQLHQRAAQASDRPAGIGIDFDVNVVQTDALGSRPVVVAGWVS